MIVDFTRLMKPGNADAFAPVAEGMPTDTLAQTLLSVGVPGTPVARGMEAAPGDFAATLDRSTAQALDLLWKESDAEALQGALEHTPGTETLARPDVASPAGMPVIAIVPGAPVMPDGADSLVTGDTVSMPRDIPVTRAADTPVADNSARVAPGTPASANESLRDAVTLHIATLLAAHEHRMRGALGRHTAAGPNPSNEGTTGALASAGGVAVVRAAAVSLPLGPAGPSMAVLTTATDPATLAAAPIDSGSAQALRGAFPPATFGNAVTGELSAAATSGGYLSANVAAGDATTVARTLSERVHAMTEKGVHEARLRLTPAELGDIAIVVRKSPMQLSVSLQVARPEALSLVQGTAALLRDMLSQRHAGEVQVSVAGMPSDGGDGGAGHARERHSGDEQSGDEGPGLALGEAARERKAFRL